MQPVSPPFTVPITRDAVGADDAELLHDVADGGRHSEHRAVGPPRRDPRPLLDQAVVLRQGHDLLGDVPGDSEGGGEVDVGVRVYGQNVVAVPGEEPRQGPGDEGLAHAPLPGDGELH